MTLLAVGLADIALMVTIPTRGYWSNKDVEEPLKWRRQMGQGRSWKLPKEDGKW